MNVFSTLHITTIVLLTLKIMGMLPALSWLGVITPSIISVVLWVVTITVLILISNKGADRW